jgi:site-specific recombinase XerD
MSLRLCCREAPHDCACTLLEGFHVLEHLPRERNASLNTIETYAYSFKLLVCFAATQLNVKPCQIEIEQLDVSIILAFLQHIESERRNSARTRNARLAAIHSFFRFLEYRLVSCLDQACQIHAIPMKKTDEPLVSYLSHEELLRSSMHRIHAQARACVIGRCCTWPSLPACVSPS